MADISDMRTSFDKNTNLSLDSFDDNPMRQFECWFDIARQSPSLVEPNAFVLSTSNQQNRLRSRTVLLKRYDSDGLIFFTNYGSQKAKDIAESNQVGVLFPWYPLEQQLIIEGTATKISQSESLRYFMLRPRGSQIGAWVSEQSQIISSRRLLADKLKQLTQHFSGKDIPLPKFWGGYRITPSRFEFWQGQPDRLHDRIQYLPNDDEAGTWQKQWLSP